MKHLKYLFIISFICLFSQSCSDKMSYLEEWRNRENIVTVKVISNTPGAPITIRGATYESLIIKDYWEKTFKSKEFTVGVEGSCSDKTVLITIELYVNGELKTREENNNRVVAIAHLKEDIDPNSF